MSAFDYRTLVSTSSIATAVNSESIRDINILLPEKALQRAYENQVSPLLERIRFNVDESKTLAKLRDLVLPKLVSGELKLRKTEKLVEKVA